MSYGKTIVKIFDYVLCDTWLYWIFWQPAIIYKTGPFLLHKLNKQYGRHFAKKSISKDVQYWTVNDTGSYFSTTKHNL